MSSAAKKIRKPRKAKFKKDPNAPKKPMTAYFLFMGSIRPEVKKANPDAKVTQLSKLIGEKWRALEGDDRKEFDDEAAQLKIKYQVKRDEYLTSAEKQEYDEEKKEWMKEQRRKEKERLRKEKAREQRSRQARNDTDSESESESGSASESD